MLKPIRNLLTLVAASLLNSRSKLIKRLVYDSWRGDYFISNGPEVFVVESKDRIVGRQLYQFGDFEIWKLQLALEICRNNGHSVRFLIDAGANIGTTIIPALKRGWVDGGIAIEPHPDNIRLLRANSALNDVAFSILQLAVGEESADAFLAESVTNSGAHKISSEGIRVRCEPLDEIVPTTPKGAMLWMDIQGHEAKALAGATRLLSEGIPIVLEFDPALLEKADIVKMASHLRGRRIFDLATGYECPALDKLAATLNDGKFTDIVAIPAKSTH